MSNSAFAPEVRGQAKAFSSLLARSVREFFKDETNRKQFESWYEQKYGTPYQWKPTTLPLFADMVGWEIPTEYVDIFSNLVIIGAVLMVSCKYIAEAFTKFKAILDATKEDKSYDEIK